MCLGDKAVSISEWLTCGSIPVDGPVSSCRLAETRGRESILQIQGIDKNRVTLLTFECGTCAQRHRTQRAPGDPSTLMTLCTVQPRMIPTRRHSLQSACSDVAV